MKCAETKEQWILLWMDVFNLHKKNIINKLCVCVCVCMNTTNVCVCVSVCVYECECTVTIKKSNKNGEYILTMKLRALCIMRSAPLWLWLRLSNVKEDRETEWWKKNSIHVLLNCIHCSFYDDCLCKYKAVNWRQRGEREKGRFTLWHTATGVKSLSLLKKKMKATTPTQVSGDQLIEWKREI